MKEFLKRRFRYRGILWLGCVISTIILVILYYQTHDIAFAKAIGYIGIAYFIDSLIR